MTRVDTRSQPHVRSLKPISDSANFSRFLSIIALTVLVTSLYFVIKKPFDCLGDPSDQYVVKNIPNIYTRLEAVDPEERDVFQDFRTSFLPHDEIVLASSDSQLARTLYVGNVTSDILIWENVDRQHSAPTRVKRTGQFTLTSQDYGKSLSKNKKIKSVHEQTEEYHDADGKMDSRADEEIESSEQYDEDENAESKIPPETDVDRGPLDDVIEQVRGQPELEEGEMGSSANLYKPSRSYTGMEYSTMIVVVGYIDRVALDQIDNSLRVFERIIQLTDVLNESRSLTNKSTRGRSYFECIHAFWKGQGDKETIRSAQANIMRQYMDAEADPCYDFYQYACGNWAALNPIPADKAGYDTFEMLRENLDTVLKELLEFKNHEEITSFYPGSHLDVEDNFFDAFTFSTHAKKCPYNKFILDTINAHSKERRTYESGENRYNIDDNIDTKESSNRIRRYLSEQTREILKPFSKMRTNFHKRIIKNRKNINRSKRSNHGDIIKLKRGALDKSKFKIKSKQIRHARRLQMYTDTFIRRRERETALIKELPLPHLHDDPARGDAALKARYLFKSCMNYDILEKRGHQPLLDLLNLMGGWPILNAKWNNSEIYWLELMANLRLYNNDILLSEWVGPDIKNSDEFVIQFDQTSLGLPTRDYFLQDNNRIYLEAYKDYLIKVALLLGGDREHVLKTADQLIIFETKLAKITSAPEDRRNVSELYRRMPLRKLEELVPEVNWRMYLSIVMNRTVQSDETVVLFALNYVRHLVQLIKETDTSTLSNYLLWRFVRHRVNNLDDRFQSAKQQFYFILFGREQSPPRWKNCISQVNSNMGMALGSMFVRKYFDEMSKNDTLYMTREIQQSFEELLQSTDWIDEKTKKLAAHKVDAMMLRIGYPDFILNDRELNERYKEVKIHPDKYFENILNILQHLTKMEQARLGQPVNKTLWNTAPAVVNAYYSRNKNQIMFPAGILQPPFYHRHFPRSLNYGGIGVVIGHEITHGFDDKGRLFDCNGNLHRWWSDSAIESFHRRAQCLINQYGQYVVPEVNMKLDGINTQGENIADNGGVKQAFRAYLHWVERHGTAGETLPGLNHTHTQLFFLNFAQVWCGAMRPEAMRNKLKTAVHSPGRFRVIGTLSNSHDFAREFRCPLGSRMNPKEKCTVW